MKIKPILNNNYLLDGTRYNARISNNHLIVKNGTENIEKKEYGSIVILSLMDICGFVYDDFNKTEMEACIKLDKEINDLEKFGIVDNYKANNIIEFENGNYMVLDIINSFDNTYLFLINENEYENDTAIVKVKHENNYNYLYIENDEEFNYVLNKLFLNFKDEIYEMWDK